MINLEHYEYKIFNDKKYTKKLYGDDLFLFFDEGNNLIRTTIGTIYQKDFENEKKNYEEYCNKKNMEYNWKS